MLKMDFGPLQRKMNFSSAFRFLVICSTALFFVSTGCQTTPLQEPSAALKETEKNTTFRMESPLLGKEDDIAVFFSNVDQFARDWRRAYEAMDFPLSNNLAETLRGYITTNYDHMEEGIQSDVPRWKEIAAGTIGFSDRKEAVALILPLLEEQSPFVRSNALLSLWKLGDKSIPLKPVALLLGDRDLGVRQSAALALTTIIEEGRGQECLFPLINALRDENPYVRSHAARALGILADAAAVKSLARALDDEVPLVRIRAALALGLIRSDRAVKDLAKHLNDPNEIVRDSCLRSLIAITGKNLGYVERSWLEWYEKRNAFRPPEAMKEGGE